MKVIRNVRLSAELIARLEPFTPRIHSGELKWQNYRIPGENSPRVPVVFKGPVPPLTPEKYDVGVVFRKGRILDHWEIRLYPPRNPGAEVEAELRYMEIEKEEEIFFKGRKPLEVIRAVGKERKAILYFSLLEAEMKMKIIVRKTESEILFKAPVIVQLRTEEERLPNRVIKLRLSDSGSNSGIEIYDRRENRFSPFAVAERIRKTIGKRNFEFWNLWEFKGDRNEIKYLFTESGLQKI